MIEDPAVLADVRNSWDGVRVLRSRLGLAFVSSFVAGPSAIGAASAAHNLPFLHACSVLGDVLEQLRDEGRFRSKSRFLGALLEASAAELPWQDWAAIKAAVESRNALAHDAQLASKQDCLRHIGAIERELLAWGVLAAS